MEGDKSSAQAQGQPGAGVCKAADRHQNTFCSGNLSTKPPLPAELPLNLLLATQS